MFYRANYPLFLEPAYQNYLWGGSLIEEKFNKKSGLKICAESWEASDRAEGLTLISNGPLKGVTLKELIQKTPTLFKSSNQFPLLIKLIDAKESLSIQVHPSDETAKIYGGEAKNEMWYILEASPDSYIYLGLKENMTKNQLEQSIKNGCLQDKMNRVKVSAGELYYIPGGLFHAIGAGVLIYEVQQNSNTTYRVYDWNRKDKQGFSRELHIHQALNNMLNNQLYSQIAHTRLIEQNLSFIYINLLRCPYFDFNRLEIKESFSIKENKRCRIYFVLEGDVAIRGENFEMIAQKGQTFLITPDCVAYMMTSKTSKSILLETITVI